MRNYLQFKDALIPFQYPEDREVEIGTEFVLEIQEKTNIDKAFKIIVTDIESDQENRRIIYHCKQL